MGLAGGSGLRGGLNVSPSPYLPCSGEEALQDLSIVLVVVLIWKLGLKLECCRVI